MEQLYLGVGRSVITPKIGAALCGYTPDHFSKSVNDDLTVTAFFFKQKDETALMISATLCEINTGLCDTLRKGLAEELEIPVENVLLCATHTHSGPNLMGQYGWGDIDREYCDTVFVPRLKEAVKEAVSSQKPVSMGVGVGESLVGINRRELTRGGIATLGQNPWGAFDPKMTVISFVDENERCVANMIHYGAHCTGAGQNVEITRDWAGVMIDRLDAVSGGVTAFFNGPEGDVGPRLTNGKTVGNLQLALELGEVAAQDAVRIYRSIKEYNSPALALLCADTAVPLAPRIPLEVALAEYEKYKNYSINQLGAQKEHYRTIIESYEKGERDLPFRYFPQTLVRLGEVLFASFPYELFSEIGLRIAKEVKDARVLSLSNANGADGYFITEDQICRGGYEVDMFLSGNCQGYLHSADTCLVGEVLKNIDQLIKERD